MGFKIKNIVGVFCLFSIFILIGCGGGGGGGTPPATPPTEPTKTYNISAQGGIGNSLIGGDGGIMNITNASPDGIKILDSGIVNTIFTSTTDTTYSLGTNPLSLSSSIVIDVVLPTDTVGANIPYMILGDDHIYISNGGTVGDDEPVTGLMVETGAVVTLGLNMSLTNATGQDTAKISLTNALVVNGTIITKDLTTGLLNGATLDKRHSAPATTADMGSLSISAQKIIISGVIDTSGGDGTRGGDGGAITLSSDIGGVYILSTAIINASGGDGSSGIGGWAGVSDNDIASGVSITSTGGIVSEGTIYSSGGSGTMGGKGAFVVMDSTLDLKNTANIYSNGGSGTTAQGGDGGGITLKSKSGLYNSAQLSSQGGDGSGGGVGGSVLMSSGTQSPYTGDLINSGNISTNGGNAISAGGGGSGGYIKLTSKLGSIKNTGALSSDGGIGLGASNSGGSGGTIVIENGDGTSADSIEIASDISVDGGLGPNGGSGGIIIINQNDSSLDSILGGIELYNYNASYLSGGLGVTNGGNADFTSALIWAFGGPITNEMEIYANGGDASDTSGVGGLGGGIDMAAAENLTNSGHIYILGGSAPLTGGDGGSVILSAGAKTTNSGSIYANGGNSTGSAPSSSAGDGGDVELASTSPETTTNTATIITVLNGSGGTILSALGTITIDGVDVTGDGTLP